MPPKPFKIALVAGEASSDMIGANLITDLLHIDPDIEIVAVGGKNIASTKADVIQNNEVFSVMGLTEVLKDLPQLMKAKKQVVNRLLACRPDVFIGVDSPDLNFSIAKSMKKNGISVIHYVSPSVWAWRPKRIYKMAQFIDGLMTLFPFETGIYKQTGINAQFVGHPLAQKIPVEVDKIAAKAALGMKNQKVIALLPGSRNREIKTLMPVFAATLKQLELGHDWQIMSSNVSHQKVELVKSLAADHELSIHWVDDTSELLKAADFALLGSGTVALEAMLCKTPMVVGYQIAAMTWRIIKVFRMMQLPYYSLPNVLHQDFLVPEVMQNDLTVENLKAACLTVLNETDKASLLSTFKSIHQSLIPEQPNQAALTVIKMWEQM